MTRYAGACQGLGFLCDWQFAADSRQSVVSLLVEHLNQIHGTGATSPALSALIDLHVTEILPGGAGKPTHAKERTS